MDIHNNNIEEEFEEEEEKMKYKDIEKRVMKAKELEAFNPILKWVIFNVVMLLGLIIFIYALNAEFEESNFKLIFLLFSIIFIFYGIKLDTGCGYLSEYYKILFKRKSFIAFLSSTPVLFFFIYFAIVIFTSGQINLGILLYFASISFFFPILLVCIISFIIAIKIKKNEKI